jgi:hypothetical protein
VMYLWMYSVCSQLLGCVIHDLHVVGKRTTPGLLQLLFCASSHTGRGQLHSASYQWHPSYLSLLSLCGQVWLNNREIESKNKNSQICLLTLLELYRCVCFGIWVWRIRGHTPILFSGYVCFLILEWIITFLYFYWNTFTTKLSLFHIFVYFLYSTHCIVVLVEVWHYFNDIWCDFLIKW